MIVTMAHRKKRFLFFLCLAPQLFLVSIFPIFSVRSYFNSLIQYQSVNGSGWIAREYPDDWAGILWLNEKMRNAQWGNSPVIVEADGDSYTDYNRVSTFTGLPTIVGWSVHEWLWRGSYDIVAPRKAEVQKVYESTDINETRQILAKYHVQYIFVGELERRKFTNLQEWKFGQLGRSVFVSGNTMIYQIPLIVPTTVPSQLNPIPPIPVEQKKTYTIVRGDNLWSLAVKEYGDGYRWKDIAETNNLTDPNLIHAGDVLMLPN